MLELYNTQTKQKEIFKPIHKNKVGIRLIEEVLSELYYAAASEFGN